MRLHTQGHTRLRTGIGAAAETRSRHLIPLVALLLVMSALCVPSVAAQTSTSAAAVRVIHASPDTPAVDVYVDGEKTVSALGFTQARGYLSVPAGPHLLQVFGQGVNPRATAPLIAVPGFAIPAGGRLSLVVEGLFANIRLTVVDDATFAPAPGKAKLRFVHAGPDVPTVNVTIIDGPVLFANTQFGTAYPYQDVNAARHDLRISPTDSGNNTAVVTSIVPEAGKTYSVYLMSLGAVQFYLDSAMPPAAPSNSVPADMGMPAAPAAPADMGMPAAAMGAPTMTPATATAPARTAPTAAATVAAAPTRAPQIPTTAATAAATATSRPTTAPVATAGAPNGTGGGDPVMMPVTGSPLGETVSTEMRLLIFAALVLIAGGITMKRYNARRWNTTIHR